VLAASFCVPGVERHLAGQAPRAPTSAAPACRPAIDLTGYWDPAVHEDAMGAVEV
jgi:hypothetical protein